VKRFLVYLGNFEAASAAREPKGVPHSESFGDRHMFPVRSAPSLSLPVGKTLACLVECAANWRRHAVVQDRTGDWPPVMPAPRDRTNEPVNTATRRVTYPLSFYNDESLAAVSATEPVARSSKVS